MWPVQAEERGLGPEGIGKGAFFPAHEHDRATGDTIAGCNGVQSALPDQVANMHAVPQIPARRIDEYNALDARLCESLLEFDVVVAEFTGRIHGIATRLDRHGVRGGGHESREQQRS